MELKDIIDENIISVGLDAADKDDALRKMADMLRQNHYIDDTEDFIADIYKREEEGKTGIGGGVAIPHGKSCSVRRIGIAIANLKNPIEWESLDGEKVQTIFLFCVSDNQEFARNHMILLSRIAAKLAADELLEQIKGAAGPAEIRACLTEE